MIQEIVETTLTAGFIFTVSYLYQSASNKAKKEIQDRYALICHDLDLQRDFLLDLYLKERKYCKTNLQERSLEQQIDFFEELKEHYSDILDKTPEKTLENIADTRYFSNGQKQEIYQKYLLIKTLINNNSQRILFL